MIIPEVFQLFYWGTYWRKYITLINQNTKDNNLSHLKYLDRKIGPKTKSDSNLLNSNSSAIAFNLDSFSALLGESLCKFNQNN